MTYISVDVEADGPAPGITDYSMVSFGAIVVEPELNRTFYRELKPVSDKWVPEALAISGFSREKCMTFEDPKKAMQDFADWLSEIDKPMFVADNNGFDFMFICWYFHHFLGKNPFGFSSTNLNSLYKGMERDVKVNIRHLRRTKHTHDALDDCRGNAEAMLALRKQGLKFSV